MRVEFTLLAILFTGLASAWSQAYDPTNVNRRLSYSSQMLPPIPVTYAVNKRESGPYGPPQGSPGTYLPPTNSFNGQAQSGGGGHVQQQQPHQSAPPSYPPVVRNNNNPHQHQPPPSSNYGPQPSNYPADHGPSDAGQHTDQRDPNAGVQPICTGSFDGSQHVFTCRGGEPTFYKKYILWLASGSSPPIKIDIPNYKLSDWIEAGFKGGEAGKIDIRLRRPEGEAFAGIDGGGVPPPTVNLSYEPVQSSWEHFGDEQLTRLPPGSVQEPENGMRKGVHRRNVRKTAAWQQQQNQRPAVTERWMPITQSGQFNGA